MATTKKLKPEFKLEYKTVNDIILSADFKFKEDFGSFSQFWTVIVHIEEKENEMECNEWISKVFELWVNDKLRCIEDAGRENVTFGIIEETPFDVNDLPHPRVIELNEEKNNHFLFRKLELALYVDAQACDLDDVESQIEWIKNSEKMEYNIESRYHN